MEGGPYLEIIGYIKNPKLFPNTYSTMLLRRFKFETTSFFTWLGLNVRDKQISPNMSEIYKRTKKNLKTMTTCLKEPPKLWNGLCRVPVSTASKQYYKTGHFHGFHLFSHAHLPASLHFDILTWLSSFPDIVWNSSMLFLTQLSLCTNKYTVLFFNQLPPLTLSITKTS